MTFIRTDDQDPITSAYRVRYILQNNVTLFEINSTRDGVQIIGTTPRYTDWVPIQEKLSWAQYQAQRLRETGVPIEQNLLEQGTL